MIEKWVKLMKIKIILYLIALLVHTQAALAFTVSDCKKLENPSKDMDLKELTELKGLCSNLPAKSASTSCNPNQEAQLKEAKTAAEALEPEDKTLTLDGGSSQMRSCVLLSKGQLRNLYKNGAPTGVNWDNYIKADSSCLKEATFCDPAKYEKCIASAKKKAATCDAAAFIVSAYGRNWENPDHAKAKTTKGGTPIVIECTQVGVETLDYEPCAKFTQNGDIMDVATAAVNKGQELYYQDKTMDRQVEAAKSGDSATGGLKALGSSLKDQENMMMQRAGMDTAKLAALASYYSSMPEYSDLKAKCLNSYPDPLGVGKESACNSAVGGQNGFAFLANQDAKEKMKAKLAQLGINVASQAMMADLLGKRAKDVNNAIANIDAFKPIDPTITQADNLQTTFCQQNPGDPKCLTGGLERTFDAMGDNVITFGDGGTGTSYQNKNPFAENNGSNSNAIGSTDRKVITSAGSAINSAQQGGGLEKTPDAAKITKDSPPTGGGAGSGGGGGGSGGGGGGNAAAPGAQGATASAVSSKQLYSGGGGSLSMMGGYGINKSKGTGKDDGNPFGKLFNKDGNKSGIVNFRDLASEKIGKKNDNIFENISRRYSTVNSDKRLLEYELTK